MHSIEGKRVVPADEFGVRHERLTFETQTTPTIPDRLMPNDGLAAVEAVIDRSMDSVSVSRILSFVGIDNSNYRPSPEFIPERSRK